MNNEKSLHEYEEVVSGHEYILPMVGMSNSELERAYKADPKPSLRPWRTLVMVECIDREEGAFYAMIPAWDPHKIIKLPLRILPTGIRDSINGEDKLHARINIGAEEGENLYFSDWEMEW